MTGKIFYYFYSKESFDNINLWIKELKTYSNPDVKIFLVGNKCDLEHSRMVFQKDIDLLMEENQIEYYIETSAKSGLNTKKLFSDIGKKLFNSFESYKSTSLSFKSNDSSSIKIHNTSHIMARKELPKPPKSKGCC